MIILDNLGYIELNPILEKECRKRGIDFDTQPLNSAGMSDVQFVGRAGVHGVEIKGAGEFIGNPTHCVEQLKKQAQKCDFLSLGIYGEFGVDGTQSQAIYRFGRKVTWSKHNSSGGVESFKAYTYKYPHKLISKVLWRIRSEGIMVFTAPTLEEFAIELCNYYEVSQEEGSLFTAIKPEKYILSEQDEAKKKFMLQVMGLQAGAGEEIARALWDGGVRSLHDLLYALSHQEGLAALAGMKLSSGKRSIGPAAVEKLRKAVGM